MEYMRVLNGRIKNAGREFLKGKTDALTRKSRLEEVLASLKKEASDTGTFLPFTEVCTQFGLEPMEELLLCALWGSYTDGIGGIKRSDFLSLCRDLSDGRIPEGWVLPAWILADENYVNLSPVLYGWMEGQMPKLPKGTELLLPAKEVCYGLEMLLEDVEIIFQTVEMNGSAALEVKEIAEPAILCIEGEAGSGRKFAMEQICAAQNLGLLLVDGDVFGGTEREINACILCAQLYEAFLCVRLGKEVREKLLEDFSSCFGFYGILKDEKRLLEEYPRAAVYMRQIPKPDRRLKLQMAKDILGEWSERLPGHMALQQLTGRQLPIGLFLRYLKNIKAELQAGNEKGVEKASYVLSSQLHLLPATRNFEELKLPKAQHGQLRQICRMIAAREDVMEQWGFGEKFSYGNGISMLFYGAPGTGKTMAAQVMANELGMPLYRVDLSQLISKYIGETQKNIGRIFDEADKCDCILLFDEADAIFTKRSDVSDAQDRYSNAETAYLLQRIEQYSGVSILATNLLQNFDEAFRRRISYMVHFPMPDMGLRKELWESIFPVQTPVSSEVDPLMLAQAFELSGASIKNAAMHGALLAMAEGTEVRMKHILSGIRNEYGKQGKSFSSSQKELLDAFE